MSINIGPIKISFQSNSDSTFLYSNQLGDLSNFALEGFELGMQHSSRPAIYTELMHCIDQNQSRRFKELLQGNFYYRKTNSYSISGGSQSEMSHTDYTPFLCPIYYPVTHYWCESTEDWEYRPVIEDLFINDMNLFYKLVSKLIATNNEAFLQALMMGFNKTDLNAQTIFNWDFRMKRKVLEQVNALKEYGQKCKDNYDTKGEHAQQIADQLIRKIQQRNATEDNIQSKFAILKFKLELLLTLHKADEHFEEDHFYKRLLVNLFTILCTCGLSNIIKYALTGDAFFYNKSDKRLNAEKIHKIIGFNAMNENQFRTSLDKEIAASTNLPPDLVATITEFLPPGVSGK